MIAVTLTWEECWLAAVNGCSRQIKSKWAGRTDKIEKEKSRGWAANIVGSLGEMAVSKALGVYWDGAVDVFKRPDVLTLQVRAASDDKGKLVFRPGDKDSEIFVLVTGHIPHLTIRGWLYGHECKEKGYDEPGYNGLPPCIMVRQENINTKLSEIPGYKFVDDGTVVEQAEVLDADHGR